MDENGLSFLVFADLHYKKGMYAVTVSDLKCILNRAYEDGVDFVIHAGDFSNDYVGSPEIVNTYLENEYNFSVYGVYGNHELESDNNTMQAVTPLLTNDSNVVWGTDDGNIGDGLVGYYYFEKNGYRIVCTDTNYSYNEELKEWEHNKTASWGAPSGNKLANSLGPRQLEWLEAVLMDAAEKGISCIVVSHASITNQWEPSPDTKAVQRIFEKVNGMTTRTVLMCINGHYHTNRMGIENGVLYFDVNTVMNGSWVPKEEQHYQNEHTFLLEHYDCEGEKTYTEEVTLTNLWQSVNTHYFTDPLSAIVKISEEGRIEISGSETSWRYGVDPENHNEGVMPKISDGWFILR